MESIQVILKSPAFLLGVALSMSSCLYWHLVIPATLLLVIGAIAPMVTKRIENKNDDESRKTTEEFNKLMERVSTLEKRLALNFNRPQG